MSYSNLVVPGEPISVEKGYLKGHGAYVDHQSAPSSSSSNPYDGPLLIASVAGQVGNRCDFVHIYAHKCIHTYIHTYMHTYMHSYMHYIYIDIISSSESIRTIFKMINKVTFHRDDAVEYLKCNSHSLVLVSLTFPFERVTSQC